MRLGVVILPDQSWATNAPRWREAEALGLDSAWTYDHLSWRTLAGKPWYSTFGVLAAVAATTTRIQLGVMVASPNFRHPALLAKDAATLDDISGGRFVLGLGSGSPDAGDALALGGGGLTATQRADRFAEFVGLTDQILRSPLTDHVGSWYEARDFHGLPGHDGRHRLRLAIAADGKRGMNLVADHATEDGDGWITMGAGSPTVGCTPSIFDLTVGSQVERLEAMRRERSQSKLLDRIYVSMEVPQAPGDLLQSARRFSQVGITHLVVHWPREDGVYAGNQHQFTRAIRHALPRVRTL